MTVIRPAYDALRTDVLDRWLGRVDGDLMLVYLDAAGVPLLTLDVDEGTRHLDELFLRYVVALVVDLRLPAVVVAVPRRTGRPTRSDRWLWRELQRRLAGEERTQLVDLVVVGEDRWWSARRADRTRIPAPSIVPDVAGAA